MKLADLPLEIFIGNLERICRPSYLASAGLHLVTLESPVFSLILPHYGDSHRCIPSRHARNTFWPS